MPDALVPLRWISADAEGFTINIYVAPPLSSEQEAIIDAAINDWYTVGFDGVFGGGAFHWIEKLPVLNGALRYAIDPGRANADQAIRALQEALSRLTVVPISEITIWDEFSSAEQ